MIKALSLKECSKKMSELNSGWVLSEPGQMLKRSFTFTNFIEAFIFVSRVTVHAEVLKHHPDLLLSYGKVKITLTTHSLKGLTNVDFDLAKKIDALDLSTKSKR